ncbi:MAG: hypothetical protein AAB370_05790, partial [Verrucomicrobiota bacterium]
MKTKISTITTVLALALLLPATAFAQIKLTGVKVFGLRADGTRVGSTWDTVTSGPNWGAYLFTGPTRAPKFLNGGNTDDSLNPKFSLSPGNYTFGFAGDSAPSAGVVLELCFDDKPDSRISVTVPKSNSIEFSGTTTFIMGDSTVTLTAIQLITPLVDLVSPHETKPNGAMDTVGTFSLAV